MKTKAFIGIVMTLVLATTLFAVIPLKAAEGWDGEIKIAVVGPHGWIQWDGQWVGATLAMEAINRGPNGVDDGGDGDDGIVIGGLNYKVVLIPVDSHAAEDPPNPSAGWTELSAALGAGADFVIGGFRTECVAPMRANFITHCLAAYATDGYAPLWFIAGASTDELIDCGGTGACMGTCTRCDYSKGRYMFRVTPMNGTTLFRQIAAFLKTYILPTRLYPMYQAPVKTAIVAEGLTWTWVMTACLAGNSIFPYFDPPANTIPNPYPSPPHPSAVLGSQAEVVTVWRTDPVSPNMDAVLIDCEDKDVRLIVHIYSAVTGVDFISTYGERQPKAVCVGINVESQMQEFFDSVVGKCEYEAFLSTLGTRNDINPNAEPYSTAELWDLYKQESDRILGGESTYPIYTMWGTYDGIMALNDNLEAHGSWDPTHSPGIPADTLIPLIESTDRHGIVGKFRYTGPGGIYHDLYCAPDVYAPTWASQQTRSLIPQWQKNATGGGNLVTVWPQDQPYSRKYQIPTWMYELSNSDLNFDGVVDIDDVMVPALGYGAYPGCTPPLPPWNIEADVTADGLIDIDDVMIPALVYGDYADEWPLPMDP